MTLIDMRFAPAARCARGFDEFLAPESNCVDWTGDLAGSRLALSRPRLRRLTALSPSAHRSGWLSMRSVGDRARLDRAGQLRAWRAGSHFWRRASIVLRMTISLRMQAMMATLGALPLAIRRR
jgi:hypothetical protein